MRHAIWLLGLGLLGCADSGPGKPLSASTKKVVHNTLDIKPDLNKQRIAVDGYIFLDGNSSDSENGKVELRLYTQPLGKGDDLLQFRAYEGTGRNQVRVPTLGKGKSAGYQTTSYRVDVEGMRFYDAAGKEHPIKDKVRLSGTVTYVPHFQGGFSHLTNPLNKREELYPFTLESVRIDTSPW